jgi:hypothetical protein
VLAEHGVHEIAVAVDRPVQNAMGRRVGGDEGVTAATI